MSDSGVTRKSSGERANSFMRRLGIYALALGTAFLLGFAPMWLRSREHARAAETAQASLRVSRIENLIAGAALDAGRGEYEAARTQASEFFTSLRAEVDRSDRSAIAPARLDAVRGLLASRDDTITLLARGDAASAARLNDLYFSFLRATGKL